MRTIVSVTCIVLIAAIGCGQDPLVSSPDEDASQVLAAKPASKTALTGIAALSALPDPGDVVNDNGVVRISKNMEFNFIVFGDLAGTGVSHPGVNLNLKQGHGTVHSKIVFDLTVTKPGPHQGKHGVFTGSSSGRIVDLGPSGLGIEMDKVVAHGSGDLQGTLLKGTAIGDQSLGFFNLELVLLDPK